MPFSEGEMWGCSGSLVKMNGLTPSGVSTVVYFASEDCSIEERAIPRLGGSIHKGKMSIGQYGFIALAVDTEGKLIGFHSMK